MPSSVVHPHPALARSRTLNEIEFIVEEVPEGGYVARARNFSIFTQAETPEELYEAARDAVHCHVDDGTAPPTVRFLFVRGDARFELEASA